MSDLYQDLRVIGPWNLDDFEREFIFSDLSKSDSLPFKKRTKLKHLIDLDLIYEKRSVPFKRNDFALTTKGKTYKKAEKKLCLDYVLDMPLNASELVYIKKRWSEFFHELKKDEES